MEENGLSFTEGVLCAGGNGKGTCQVLSDSWLRYSAELFCSFCILYLSAVFHVKSKFRNMQETQYLGQLASNRRDILMKTWAIVTWLSQNSRQAVSDLSTSCYKLSKVLFQLFPSWRLLESIYSKTIYSSKFKIVRSPNLEPFCTTSFDIFLSN